MYKKTKYSFKDTGSKRIKPTSTSESTPGAALGSNSERHSEFMFINRKYYQDVVLKRDYLSNVKTHSFWENDRGRLYGRVNFKGDSVFLPESQLSQIPGARGEFYALSPVVDALSDLAEHLREKQRHLGNRLIDNPDQYVLITNLMNLNIASAWQSFFVAYTEHLEAMSEAFTSAFLVPTRERKITGFKSYYEQYLEAAKSLARHKMLTPTAFMRSKTCPLACSGLIINILDLNPGEDSKKNLLLQSEGYLLLASEAKKFGFMIDANAPWRLIADIFSNPMRRYMANYGVPLGKDRVFDELYADLNFYEIEYMRFYVTDQYNKYVQSRPTISIHQSKCKSKNKKADDLSHGWKPTSIRTIIREPVDAFSSGGQFDVNSKFAQKYNELFWLRFYYNIRLIEEDKEMDISRFNEKFKDVARYYRIHGQSKTVQAINRELIMNLRIF